MRCPVGKYDNSYSTAACEQCPAGRAQSLLGQTLEISCLFCDAMTYSSATGNAACSTCPAGLYSGVGATECAPCPVGTYLGASGCEQCPAGLTTRDAGAVSVSDCGCKASFYTGANGTCTNCPYLSTTCDEAATTLDAITLREEYWRAASDSTQFRLCKTPGYCIGGTSCHNSTANPNATMWLCNGYCAPGHTGPFCELCLNGFVKSGMEGRIGCSPPCPT